MIVSLKGRIAIAVAAGRRANGFPPELVRAVENKLAMIAAAVKLDDLKSPPGNRLEALKGDRHGQWSIRINDQWRVCFEWKDGDASGVEIFDYH